MGLALIIAGCLWIVVVVGAIAADRADERRDEAWRRRQPWHPDNLPKR